MVDAAHATSAAPTYFEPLKLGAPLADRRRRVRDQPVDVRVRRGGRRRRTLLLSLGCGEHTRAAALRQVKDWGELEWAEPIIDVVFDGSADAVDAQLERRWRHAYIRLQTRLDEASDDLDDASAENLAALRARGGAADRRRTTRTSTAPAPC